MKTLQLLLCTCLCISGGRCLAAEKPNILFLLSDDHSYPYLGCYGNKDVRTPNLDRLASQGLRFDRMFVGCPQGVPDPTRLTLPGHLPDLPGVRSDLARYIAEVEHLDADVQSVLDVLEQRGLANNTVVVFMGDNGMALPHGKGTLTDPGIAVPLLVRWPGVVRPGAVTRTLVSGEDFAPTMLEIAGVAPLKEMSGVSYLKLLRGEAFEGRKYIFAERGPHGGDGGMKPDILASTFDLSRCIRSANFKLIYCCTPHQAVAPVDSQRDPGWQQMKTAFAEGKLAPEFVRAYFTTPRSTYELYDLEADPSELTNLAGNKKYAQVERELKEALTEKMVLDWDFLPTPLR